MMITNMHCHPALGISSDGMSTHDRRQILRRFPADSQGLTDLERFSYWPHRDTDVTVAAQVRMLGDQDSVFLKATCGWGYLESLLKTKLPGP